MAAGGERAAHRARLSLRSTLGCGKLPAAVQDAKPPGGKDGGWIPPPLHLRSPIQHMPIA